MAICKKCGKTIDDGLEYCSECSSMGKADESYLDSLLSSVSQNTANPLTERLHRTQTTASPVTPKFSTRKKISTENYNILSDSDDDDFLNDLFDSADIPEFPIGDDAQTPAESAIFDGASDEELADLAQELPAERDDEAMDMLLGSSNGEEAAPSQMSEEESLLADLLDSVGDDVETHQPADDPIAALDEAFAIANGEQESTVPENESEAEVVEEDEGPLEWNPDNGEEVTEADNEGESGAENEGGSEAGADGAPDIDFFSSDASPEEIEAAKEAVEQEAAEREEAERKAAGNEEGGNVSDLAALGEEFDIPIIFSGSETEEGPEKGKSGENADETASEGAEEPSGKKVKIVSEGGSEGGDEDILEFWNSINNELGDGTIIEGVENSEEAKAPEKPEKQLSPEEQAEQDELAALLSGLPGVDENSPGVGELEAPAEEKPEPKKKKGFFARIFGNVKEELTEEQIEERKQAALDKLDRDEEAAAKAKEEKAEEKKAKAEAAAEAKKAKAEAATEAKKKKEEEKKAKADKKAELRKALVEEIEENEGKINKVGASLVFLVFGAIFAFIAIGTSVYTYRVAIEQARKDFEDDRYEEAYNDIYGIDVKAEDQELYDRIMVVNYVNSQLLGYLRYTGLEMENEALDALLKGLRRYEKSIFLAKDLQVDEDLDFLKGEILKALGSGFGLSEAQAYEIINSGSQELYSQAVRGVVENLNN